MSASLSVRRLSPAQTSSHCAAGGRTVLLEKLLPRLKARGKAAVDMQRFRPNIVVGGLLPWEEDTIKRLAIDGVEFHAWQRCGRCWTRPCSCGKRCGWSALPAAPRAALEPTIMSSASCMCPENFAYCATNGSCYVSFFSALTIKSWACASLDMAGRRLQQEEQPHERAVDAFVL